MHKRAIILVMDSVGAGALPDAAEYGDEGSDTLGNMARVVGGLNLPVMGKLGLGNVHDIIGVPPESAPSGLYCKMSEKSKGKDTISGHWEIAGVISTTPFDTFPDGFPKDFMDEYERRIGTKTIGNYPASGTAIIDELAPEHIRTGYPIIYTSADSVFQIAAHEGVIPIERQYELCEIARELLNERFRVGRVIARPFIGEPGAFKRTNNRHDYAVSPPEKTLLDHMKESGYDVIGVGKIKDIFNDCGVTESHRTNGNMSGLEITRDLLKKESNGLIFVNLVDFDMLYGHRNDPQGYARALEDMDSFLPQILDAMKPEDIIFITADHGCDPTTVSTDHSREYVPLLVYSPSIEGGINLGIRKSFCDIAKTIADIFGISGKVKNGESFVFSFKKKPEYNRA